MRPGANVRYKVVLGNSIDTIHPKNLINNKVHKNPTCSAIAHRHYGYNSIQIYSHLLPSQLFSPPAGSCYPTSLRKVNREADS